MSINKEDLEVGVILKTDKGIGDSRMKYDVLEVMGIVGEILFTDSGHSLTFDSIRNLNKHGYYIKKEEEDKWVDVPRDKDISFSIDEWVPVRIKDKYDEQWRDDHLVFVNTLNDYIFVCKKDVAIYCQVRESDLDKFK